MELVRRRRMSAEVSGRPRRVLLISPFPPPNDGIGEHTRNLAEAWLAEGADVLVLSRGSAVSSERECEGTVQVARCLHPIKRRSSRQVVDTFRPDFVLCQFAVSALTTVLPAAIDACRRARAHGAVIAVVFHEPAREIDRLGPFGPRLYRRVADVADFAIALSTAAGEALADSGVARRIVQVAVGVPPSVPVSREDIERVRRSYNLGDSLVVLSMGFIHSDKGLDTLLEAAPIVNARVAQPLRFVVAGAPRGRRGLFKPLGWVDARLDRSLRARAGMPDQRGRFTFVGFVPRADVAPLLASAAVFVLAYTKTTQSAIAADVLASGTPMVATFLPGLVEALDGAAVYAPPGNASQLAERVIDVLTDADLGNRLRAASLEHGAAHRFSQVVRDIGAAAFPSEMDGRT